MNETQLGDLELVPTLRSIGVYSSFVGDDNGNNIATMEYRESGGSWRPAPVPMVVDRRAEVPEPNTGWGEVPLPRFLVNPYVNQWRGNIMFLNPETTYEVRVTYYDPDGVTAPVSHQGIVTTWVENPPSNGRTLHISPSGVNSNDGLTEATARQTPAGIAAIAQPGDTVLCHAGSYAWASGSISCNGLYTNYITFQGAGDGDAIMTGMAEIPGSYLRFRDLVLSGSGTVARVTGDWVIFEENRFDTSSQITLQYGIGWGPDVSGSHALIRNNTGYFTLVLQWTGGNHVIYGNNFDIVAKTSSDLLHSVFSWSAMVGGGTYRDSDVYDNHMRNAGDEFIESEGVNMNVRIWGNFMKFNNGSRGGMGIGFSPVMIGPCYCFRNIIIDYMNSGFKLGKLSTGELFVYHNTIYTTPRGYYAFADSGGEPFYREHFRNNLCVVRNSIRCLVEYIGDSPLNNDWRPLIIDRMGLTEPLNDWDYNLYWSPELGHFYSEFNDPQGVRHIYTDLPSFQAGTGQELHGLYANPLLVDPANDDLRLQGGSPAIDAGVLLPGFNDADSPWPYTGAGPDIGAFEYGAAPPSVILLIEDPGLGGTISPAPGQYTKSQGDTVDLQATPDSGYTFDGWMINGVLVSTNPSYSFTINTSTVVSASFSPQAPTTYDLTMLAPAEGGYSDPGPGVYPHNEGELVTVTAYPNAPDYEFEGWQENGATISTSATFQFNMTRDITLTPVFSAVPPPPVDVSLTLSATAGGTTYPPPGTYTYTSGDAVTVEADPDTGYKFSGWYSNSVLVSQNAVYSFIISQDMAMEARFTQAPPSSSTGPIVAAGVGLSIIAIIAILAGKRP